MSSGGGGGGGGGGGAAAAQFEFNVDKSSAPEDGVTHGVRVAMTLSDAQFLPEAVDVQIGLIVAQSTAEEGPDFSFQIDPPIVTFDPLDPNGATELLVLTLHDDLLFEGSGPHEQVALEITGVAWASGSAPAGFSLSIGSAQVHLATITDDDPRTQRASLPTVGIQALDSSNSPTVSADGRRVAFHSWADELGATGPLNQSQCIVRDLQTGVTTLVSKASTSNGGMKGDRSAFFAKLSADGRFVAFASLAGNLVPGFTNQLTADIYLHELGSAETTIVSTKDAVAMLQADQSSYLPAISANGGLIAFSSDATNLVDGDTNGVRDVFVRNRLVTPETVTRISQAVINPPEDGPSDEPALSADGRYVTFQSQANNLVTGLTTVGVSQIYRFDSGPTPATTLISFDSGGAPGLADSFQPAISDDGQWIAFSSLAQLVPEDNNAHEDVYLRDVDGKETILMSVNGLGQAGNARSFDPSISSNGKWVLFPSEASDLVDDDGNGQTDVFLRDKDQARPVRVNLKSNGGEAHNGPSTGTTLTPDGRYVVFESEATDLVPGDTNGVSDVFITSPAELLASQADRPFQDQARASCPGALSIQPRTLLRGAENRVLVSGLLPGAVVHLFAGPGGPALTRERMLSLPDRPAALPAGLMGTAQADAIGNAAVSLVLPGSAPLVVHLQAIAHGPGHGIQYSPPAAVVVLDPQPDCPRSLGR